MFLPHHCSAIQKSVIFNSNHSSKPKLHLSDLSLHGSLTLSSDQQMVIAKISVALFLLPLGHTNKQFFLAIKPLDLRLQ